MDKKTLFVVGIIIVAIVGGLAYVSINNSMKPSKSETAKTKPTQSVLKSPTTPSDAPVNNSQPAVAGQYVGYSDQTVQTATGTKLLFFHAPWCPQCRDLEASIKTSTLPDNLTIFKVDYDSNQALRKKYGVTIQTTIVKIDAAGEKIESYVAYEEPSFESVQRELLE